MKTVRLTQKTARINLSQPTGTIRFNLISGLQGPQGIPGGAGSSYETTFNNATLSPVTGILVINHNLGNLPSGLTVFDENNIPAFPDDWSTTTMSASVTLLSYVPLVGTWSVSLTS